MIHHGKAMSLLSAISLGISAVVRKIFNEKYGLSLVLKFYSDIYYVTPSLA